MSSISIFLYTVIYSRKDALRSHLFVFFCNISNTDEFVHQTELSYFPPTHIPLGIWKTFEVTLHDSQMRELIWTRNGGVPPRNEKIWKWVFIFFSRCIFQSLLKYNKMDSRLNSRAHMEMTWPCTSAVNQIITFTRYIKRVFLIPSLLMAFYFQFFSTTFPGGNFCTSVTTWNDRPSCQCPNSPFYYDQIFQTSVPLHMEQEGVGWTLCACPIMGLFLAQLLVKDSQLLVVHGYNYNHLDGKSCPFIFLLTSIGTLASLSIYRTLKISFWKFQKINYFLLPHFISILFYIISSPLFIFYSYNFSQTEGIWPIMNSILLCILQNNWNSKASESCSF